MANDVTWTFRTPTGSSGSFWFGGYIIDAGSANNFSPAVNLGTANVSYAAHVWFVLGGAGGVVIRVTGTSITDAGVRTTGDTEDVDTTGYTTNDIVETDKKWIGQVQISVASGTPLSCNYGWSKYWDNRNTNFVLRKVEAVWLGGGNDTDPDIRLHHYKANGSYGWTYNGGGAATMPSAFTSMVSDHGDGAGGGEIEVRNGVEGAWKRANLSEEVLGSQSEGLMLEIVTTANGTFELGNFLFRIQQTPNEDISVSRIGPRVPPPPDLKNVELGEYLLELSRIIGWDLDQIHRSIWSLNVYGGGNTDEGPDPAAEP